MSTVPNFPSNRDSGRRRRQEKEQDQALVHGGVRRRTSVANNVRNIGNGLFDEIILPALKDMVYSFFTSGMRMFIFGPDNQGPRGGSNRTVRLDRTSYNQPYRQNRSYSRVGRPTRRQDEMVDYQDVVFDSLDDAKMILGKMQEYAYEYGKVTLGDLYRWCGLNYNYTHERWGWRDLSGVRVEAVHDGYIIGFGEAIFFND